MDTTVSHIDTSRVVRSLELRARARKSLAGGVSTAFRYYERPTPLFFRQASGATLTDVDGKRYIDYACGFGPVILGHGHPAVSKAVAAAAGAMQQIGGQQESEIELAETLCRLVPAFDVVRPSVSGTEAVHAALRLARAATGRNVVVKFHGHYHGWLDDIYTGDGAGPGAEPATAGQTSEALTNLRIALWNDIESVQRLFEQHPGEIAAVIMEPLPCNGGVIPAKPGFLEAVRDLAHDAGALVVFDEVITGFRIRLGGAQEMLGLTPDLAVVAKAMGNGFPVSAFGGRADLMDLVADNRALHAGTYNGGGISVAASLATIAALESEPIHERLTNLGTRLRERLVALAAAHGHKLLTQGPGPVFFAWFTDQDEITTYDEHMRADAKKYSAFAALMSAEGVRLIPAGRWYLNAAHTDADVEATLAAADRAFTLLPA